MRKKLKDSGGFTLVEMLCAVVILILLCLLLNTGLQMAMRTYRAITAESETQLLLNTLVDAIADELRYAHDVSDTGSLTYNGGRNLSINTDGRVVVDNEAGAIELLPTAKDGKGGAYHGGAYKVGEMTIDYDSMDCFTVKLKVIWTQDENINAETPEEGVVIRCLNPPAEETTGEEEGAT